MEGDLLLRAFHTALWIGAAASAAAAMAVLALVDR
jgi:hypothetical protein